MRLGYVLFVGLACYFIFDTIRDLASPRVVWVYPIECKGKALGNICEGGIGQPMMPSKFAAFPDRQEVVEYFDGNVVRLKGCNVFDWHTWNCFDQDAGVLMTSIMDRGRFTEIIERRVPTVLPDAIYVPAWLYYFRTFTWKLSG
jgi:hypothetical protein